MKPNRWVDLVHWKTGKLIERCYFIDSTQHWAKHPNGTWYVAADHQPGFPTEEWLRENPKP